QHAAAARANVRPELCARRRPRRPRSLPRDDRLAPAGGAAMTSSTPIRALVVDDEPHARENVLALLRDEPRWQVIGTCVSAAALRAGIAAEVPEAVFLDVRLPGADGVSLARLLQGLSPRPHVVFTTAYDGYAVAAFELQAIDYLLKPFDDQHFHITLHQI